MKLSKLKKVLSKTMNLIISEDANGNQWIGDGVATYSLEGYPKMTPAQILNVLGVSEDPEKRAMWYIDEYGPQIPEQMQLSLIDEDGNVIEFNGVRATMLKGSNQRIFWTKQMYLQPQSGAQTQHYLCTDEDQNLYVASFDGMFMTAIIKKMNFSDPFINWLHMASQSASARYTEQKIETFKEEDET